MPKVNASSASTAFLHTAKAEMPISELQNTAYNDSIRAKTFQAFKESEKYPVYSMRLPYITAYTSDKGLCHDIH